MGRPYWPYDLFEVFCGPNSKLTEQVQSLKGQAMRFGLSQGNLQKPEGRKLLFTAICRHCPKGVWMSPVCQPWSRWSNLNSQKSVEMWDKIHSERREMLIQVALCLVVCKHQHRNSRQAHGEQPQGSQILSLPYVNEVFQYILNAKPDMCAGGNLQDPGNHKCIKKGMQILTTSQKMYSALDFHKCPGTHDHQPIEGSTLVYGKRMLRSQFTEQYSRKFARLLAKTILKTAFPLEKPVGSLTDPVLSAFDVWSTVSQANAVSDHAAKRRKLTMARASKFPAADRSLERDHPRKRQRIKQYMSMEHPTSLEPESKLKGLVAEIETQLPRVGKKLIQQPTILQVIQELMPDKIINGVTACKGTERTMAP